MISDEQIEINVAKYMHALEDKYAQNQQRRKKVEELIDKSVTTIQRKFRSYILKKKIRCALKIQRTWKKYLEKKHKKNQIIERFRFVFYGTKILWFFKRKRFQNQTIQYKKRTKPGIIQKVKRNYRLMISKVEVLTAEHRYINKYCLYLRQDFQEKWQAYQKRLKKDLLTEMNKRWTKINEGKKIYYMTETDKKVDPQKYIESKLDTLFQQNNSKVQRTIANLKETQSNIMNAISYRQQVYRHFIIYSKY